MITTNEHYFSPLLSRLLGCCGLVVLLFAAPAQAVSMVSIPDLATCKSVEATKGCLFVGNIAPKTVEETQAVYRKFASDNDIANPKITLNYLFKSDDGADFPGALTGSSTSGGWSTQGYRIDFLAVKAANNFVLYKLASPASSGLWSTIDIPNKGNLKDLSHLAFFGSLDASGAPEPASWAMMIIGIGFVGYNVRRRRRLEVVAA